MNTIPAYDPMKLVWEPLEFTVSGLNTMSLNEYLNVNEVLKIGEYGEDYECILVDDFYLKGYSIE